MNASLYEIASMVEGIVIGDKDIIVSSLSSIDNIASGSLVFADGPANIARAERSDAAVILVNQSTNSNVKPVIQVSHPFKAFINLMNNFYPTQKPNPICHPTAVIEDDVTIGNNVFIGPYVTIESGSHIHDNCVIKSHVTIGRNVEVGKNTILHPHVTIYAQTQIGCNVIIHASTVIGSDGFGYVFVDNHHLKVPHIGHVVIGDNVEIGANTVVDKATMGATSIGAGTKIDNLVQIAHSVTLGKNNILCAFTGIAGSTTSGDNVIFAANVGVSDHVRIDDGVILTARAGVPPKKHLRKGNVYLGNPARPRDKAIEQELSVTRIPLMRKTLRALSEKVEQLTQRMARYEAEEE